MTIFIRLRTAPVPGWSPTGPPAGSRTVRFHEKTSKLHIAAIPAFRSTVATSQGAEFIGPCWAPRSSTFAFVPTTVAQPPRKTAPRSTRGPSDDPVCDAAGENSHGHRHNESDVLGEHDHACSVPHYGDTQGARPDYRGLGLATARTVAKAAVAAISANQRVGLPSRKDHKIRGG